MWSGTKGYSLCVFSKMAHFLKNLVSNFSINILENGLNLKKSATHIFYVILFFTIQRNGELSVKWGLTPTNSGYFT